MSEPSEDVRELDVAGRIYKIEMRQASFEKFKASVEVVAIVLAGVWGFYQFIYEDKIKPFSETPSLTITLKLEKLGTRGPWQAIRGTETVVNDSKIRVSILAERSISMASTSLPSRRTIRSRSEAKRWNVNHAYRIDNPILLQSHAVFFAGGTNGNGRWWLRPGDTSTRSAIYFVKVAQYDVIRYDANYQFSKYDVVPPFKPSVLPNGSHALVPGKRLRRCGRVSAAARSRASAQTPQCRSGKTSHPSRPRGRTTGKHRQSCWRFFL